MNVGSWYFEALPESLRVLGFCAVWSQPLAPENSVAVRVVRSPLRGQFHQSEHFLLEVYIFISLLGSRDVSHSELASGTSHSSCCCCNKLSDKTAQFSSRLGAQWSKVGKRGKNEDVTGAVIVMRPWERVSFLPGSGAGPLGWWHLFHLQMPHADLRFRHHMPLLSASESCSFSPLF